MSHLREVNMGYVDHMLFALSVSLKLFIAGSLCVVHAFLPFIFTDSASKRIKLLSRTLESR